MTNTNYVQPGRNKTTFIKQLVSMSKHSEEPVKASLLKRFYRYSELDKIKADYASSLKYLAVAGYGCSHDSDIIIQGLPSLKEIRIKNYVNNIIITSDAASLKCITIEECIGTVTIEAPCKRLCLESFTGQVIFKHNSLEHLRIKRSHMKEIGFLERQTNMRKFLVFNSTIDDKEFVNSFPKMKQLKKLEFLLYDIEEFPALTELSNLKHIHITGGKLLDLSFLKGLALKSLIIEGVSVSSLVPLISMSIEYLKVTDVHVKDYQPIGAIKGLKDLHLCGNSIEDIDFLSRLSGLEKLCLNNNRIINVKPLGYCSSLVRLELENNYIYDIEPLYACPKLQSLKITSNFIFYVDKDAMNIKKSYTCDNYFTSDPFDGSCQEDTKDMENKLRMHVDDAKTRDSLNDVKKRIIDEYPIVATKKECRNLFPRSKTFDKIASVSIIFREAKDFVDVLRRLYRLIMDHKDGKLFMEILDEDLQEGCLSGKVLQLVSVYCSFFGIPIDVDVMPVLISGVISDTYAENPFATPKQILFLVRERMDILLAKRQV